MTGYVLAHYICTPSPTVPSLNYTEFKIVKIIFKSKSPLAYSVKQKRTRIEIWDRSSVIGRLKLN